MPRPFAHTLHALVAAFALVAASSAFAQTKPPYVGKTRGELIEQLGQPKSTLKAGTREVMFFEHVKITMRNGVAIESEAVADDATAPRRPSETAPAGGPAAAAPGALPPGSAQPAPNNPVPPAQGPAAGSPSASPDANAASAKTPEPTLAIKYIKSGGASSKSAPRPATTTPAPVAPAPSAAVEKKLPPAATASAPAPQPATPPASEVNKAVAPAVATAPAGKKDETPAVAATETPAVDEPPAKPAVDAKKKAAVRQRWRLRRDAETEDENVQIFSTRSYIVGAIAIVAGAGFLWWRRNQRGLALAATAVSHPPFEAAAAGPADTTGMFSADLIGKLGPKKFERLVASYYAKTGVVAERTNAAPESPVHIKIFWKGEPKPFAGVQCHADPPTLIGPKPVMELFLALSSADIRRGYIVTTGKFNVEARDLAEEKHFTLLPGDIFLEKLNALPPAARAELLKETATEDQPPPPAPAAVTA